MKSSISLITVWTASGLGQANTLSVTPRGTVAVGLGVEFPYSLEKVLDDAIVEVPAVLNQDGTVKTPAIPARPATCTSLFSGTATMTDQQWKDWSAGGTPESDAAYILTCVAANLGLTLA